MLADFLCDIADPVVQGECCLKKRFTDDALQTTHDGPRPIKIANTEPSALVNVIIKISHYFFL